MTLCRIALRLARNPGTEFANGDERYGYMLVAPLDVRGFIDEAEWKRHAQACIVHHISPDLPAPREGLLKRRGDNWYFDYEAGTTDDDEPVFKLGQHPFRSGEYVTITDEGNRPLTYAVRSVVPA